MKREGLIQEKAPQGTATPKEGSRVLIHMSSFGQGTKGSTAHSGCGRCCARTWNGFLRPFLALNAVLVYIASQVDKGLTRTFGFMGSQIGYRPWATIIFSFACAGACCAGFKRVAEDTSDTLFTPPGAQSLDDRDYIQSVFGNAVGAMSIDLYASRRGETGENVLNKEGLSEFQRLWDRAVKDVTVTWRGDEYGLRDVCSPVSSLNKDCKVRSILQAFNFNRNGEIDNIQDNSQIIDAVNSDSFTDVYGRPMHLPSVLGGIERDGAGRVVAAEALASTINLEYSMEREQMGRSWFPAQTNEEKSIIRSRNTWVGSRSFWMS
ncbi:hypothetical protein DUNSADRAFT_7536 [Dunaliella salina]|uniref:Uncharacterized protein n=1 Tax=Dunaliella salina TaxID=3046 RepID=A0ABQ7GL58_DUNSA|nr:hypothetical protein DUNSADRAFT_7536 [Dunaliella salina]|eukprot:KAF5835341.1 hypothetical protein DUNSADRAFT_7536 [Dunaliella salina]